MMQALLSIALTLSVINHIIFFYNIYIVYNILPVYTVLGIALLVITVVILVITGLIFDVLKTDHEKWLAARDSFVLQLIFLLFFLIMSLDVFRFLYSFPWPVVFYLLYFGAMVAIPLSARGAREPEIQAKKRSEDSRESRERVLAVLSKSPYKTSYLVEEEGKKIVKVEYGRVDIVVRGLGYWLQLAGIPGVARLIRFRDNVFYREYIEGKSLREILIERGRLGVSEVCSIALGVAMVLEKAHGRGIVHCDLKPENIIVRDLEKGDIVIIDWEFSARDGDDLTVQPRTALYMPRSVDRVSKYLDIYALGVIIDEMISGRPFATRVAATEIDRSLAEVVNRCLEGSDIKEIIEMLSRICEKTKIHSESTS